MLPIGKENAISQADLATRWATDGRGVRLIVAALRRWPSVDGYILVAGQAGYWLSDIPQEVREWRLIMQRKSQTTERQTDSATAWLRQVELEEVRHG